MSAPQPRTYRWMSDLLDVLYAEIDLPMTAVLLGSRDDRAEAARSHASIAALRSANPDVQDDEFDNLLVALLSLRAKFDRVSAMEKVEMNIAMREGRA
jgi:hypothetical protein